MVKNKSYHAVYLIIACLALLLLTVMRTPAVHAWDETVDCEFCGHTIHDSWICDEGDHCGWDDTCGCWQENHCSECGTGVGYENLCPDCGTCKRLTKWQISENINVHVAAVL